MKSKKVRLSGDSRLQIVNQIIGWFGERMSGKGITIRQMERKVEETDKVDPEVGPRISLGIALFRGEEMVHGIEITCPVKDRMEVTSILRKELILDLMEHGFILRDVMYNQDKQKEKKDSEVKKDEPLDAVFENEPVAVEIEAPKMRIVRETEESD
jgi:hypothetical protein